MNKQKKIMASVKAVKIVKKGKKSKIARNLEKKLLSEHNHIIARFMSNQIYSLNIQSKNIERSFE
jgi:hypothetical protein